MRKFALPKSYQKLQIAATDSARVPPTPNDNVWTDMGNYWLNDSPQGGDSWKKWRQYRLTASNYGAAIGQSSYKTPKALAEEMAGIRPQTLTAYNKMVMDHGTNTEPIARDWYARARGVEVREIGLAVPKWDPRIGASLDGDVLGTKGMIEIKCPQGKLYKDLVDYVQRVKNGWTPPKDSHSHIFGSHYCQMQGGMAITEKEWCDYVVYCTGDQQVFMERVPFNKKFWDETLYPGICAFLDNELIPLLGDKRPMHPVC